ncbi:unnamed protein product, partial [marine sediment metagenome]
MATIKQCKLLAAKSKEAGMEYDFESFKELENGEVDDKLAEIEKFRIERKVVGTQKKVKPTTELNGMRFGMVYKIIREMWTTEQLRTQRAAFEKAVITEYNLVTEIEEALVASSSSPRIHEDLIAGLDPKLLVYEDHMLGLAIDQISAANCEVV